MRSEVVSTAQRKNVFSFSYSCNGDNVDDLITINNGSVCMAIYSTTSVDSLQNFKLSKESEIV